MFSVIELRLIGYSVKITMDKLEKRVKILDPESEFKGSFKEHEMKLMSFDIEGRDLRVGDWVRVIAVPLSIQDSCQDTKHAFSKAVGETLQIESIDECTGNLELDFYPKLGGDTIWLESFCVKRFRRYKKHSKRFLKILELNDVLALPKFVFTCKAVWPLNGSYEESIKLLEFSVHNISHHCF